MKNRIGTPIDVDKDPAGSWSGGIAFFHTGSIKTPRPLRSGLPAAFHLRRRDQNDSDSDSGCGGVKCDTVTSPTFFFR